MSKQILPLTGLEVGKVSADVLVCGDPGRATRIAEQLQQVEMLADQREYRSYRGLYCDRPVTICSHGIGAAGAAIAFEELIAAGARRIIRVGTCGGLQSNIESGDLVVATAAVQNTGYGRLAAPEGYPAVANMDLTLALRRAAEKVNGRSPHTGIVLTSDIFYPGVSTQFMPDYPTLSAANILAVEMECAALFVVGSLRNVQTAAILTADGNVLEHAETMETYAPHRDVVQTAVLTATIAALETLANCEG
jgi:uridine phosphorylase